MAKPAKPAADLLASQGRRKAVKRSVFMAAVIVIVAFLVYLPSMRGDYVWDDTMMLTENPIVKDTHGLSGLRRFWFTREAYEYFPMANSSLWLEWRLWGVKPTGYHVTNVLLHASSALLLWLALRKLAVPGAWLAALVFAVHPVNVVSVSWISERKNTLSLVFFLMAILFYLKFEDPARPRQWRWYFLSAAAFLLALLSKTSVVMLPFVLVGCVWWRRRKLSIEDALNTVPFFAMSLALGLVTVWFQHTRGGAEKLLYGSFFDRLAGAGRVVWFYLGKDLLPQHVSIVYPRWEIGGSPAAFAPVILLAAVFVVLWFKRETWGRPLLFGLGYFVVTLGPVLGLMKMYYERFSRVADHWQYVSLIGVVALAVGLAGHASRSWGIQRRMAGVALATLLVGALCLMTWMMSSSFRNEEALWRHTVSVNPHSWVAHDTLGVILLRKGRVQEAISHGRAALLLEPNEAKIHNNLGHALFCADRVNEGMAEYERAIALDSKLARAHYNLGIALFSIGKVNESIAEYENALRADGSFVSAYVAGGLALQRAGRTEESIGAYTMALRLEPGNADIHSDLGDVFAKEGRLDEAAREYREALRSEPRHAAASFKLAEVLARQGKPMDIIAHYREVVRLSPNSAEARTQLGYVLAERGELAEAVVHHLEAIRLNPNLGEAHNNLGVAYYKQGSMAEAAEEFKKATQLIPDNVATWNNLCLAMQALGKPQEAAAAYQEAERRKTKSK